MAVDVSRLKDLYPLDSLRPEHLEALTREGELSVHARGELLFRAGDQDERTVYLLSGEVRGDYPDGRQKSISGGSLQGRYPLGDLQPRRFTATVCSDTDAEVLSFDRRFVEKVLTFDQLVRSGRFRTDPGDPDASRWAFRLLQSKALRKVPAGSLERLFTRFEPINVKDGQTIIREGDDGDYFYVIKEGAAAVSQMQDGG
ncbi:MAG: cyclic nucleotide-binding domain-containing protein, partial [Xanthomonadales bacterium]|nr:cyclic nucleotide-binding domain-containing protein [Xanthomonadales bacterium]